MRKHKISFITDHKAYKALNVYDFSQKKYKSRIMNSILILLSKFPSIRKEIYSNKIKDSIIEPLKKFWKMKLFSSNTNS